MSKLNKEYELEKQKMNIIDMMKERIKQVFYDVFIVPKGTSVEE